MGMIGSKPLASLSSGLLARKGQAKPAMRPQTFNPAASLDDLGWNDMGHPPADASPRRESQPLTAEPRLPSRGSEASPEPEASPPEPQPLPPVLVERDALAARIVPVVRAATVAPDIVARIGRDSAAQTARGKAAFTLRLDADRHLRLRLASAVTNRSAQALVAEALDRFLDTMPEVEALAARLSAKDAR